MHVCTVWWTRGFSGKAYRSIGDSQVAASLKSSPVWVPTYWSCILESPFSFPVSQAAPIESLLSPAMVRGFCSLGMESWGLVTFMGFPNLRNLISFLISESSEPQPSLQEEALQIGGNGSLMQPPVLPGLCSSFRVFIVFVCLSTLGSLLSFTAVLRRGTLSTSFLLLCFLFILLPKYLYLSILYSLNSVFLNLYLHGPILHAILRF